MARILPLALLMQTKKTNGAEAPHAPNSFPTWLLFAFIAAVVAKMLLVSGQTIYAIGNSPHDDRLFLELASNLLIANWLGPYNEITLAKGPFFPMWIAGSVAMGLPLRLTEQLLYAGASAFCAVAFRPILRRDWGTLVIFLLILFNPLSFSDPTTTRVLREGIYPALTLFVLASSTGLMLRTERPLRTIWLWSLASGVSLTAFWLTREESVWIFPYLLPVAAWTLYRTWFTSSRSIAKVLFCIFPFLILGIGISAVSFTNKLHYGVYLIGETRSPDFLNAYGALLRVKHSEPLPFVLLPRETRNQIYQTSPSFRTLQEAFESPGFWWASNLGVEKRVGKPDEIPAGWLMWALRAAAANAGYHRSATTAASFYRQLANEINDACEEQRLNCLPRRATLLPPWRPEYLDPLTSAVGRSLVAIVTLQGFRAATTPSEGSAESLLFFRQLTRERLAPPLSNRHAETTYSVKRLDELKVASLNLIGHSIQAAMPYLVALGLAGYFVLMIRGRSDTRARTIWLIQSFLAAAILARVVLLSFIDAALFPAINQIYLSPAIAVFFLLIALTLAYAIDEAGHLTALRRRSSRPCPPQSP